MGVPRRDHGTVIEPAEVRLPDGRPVRFRAMQPDDEDRLLDFHSRLSAETIYLRFFSAHPRLLPAEVVRFTHVDHHNRVALVAVDTDDRIIAVGRYDRAPDTDRAEVAFVVDDAHQGMGLGRELLCRLAPIARGYGICRFVAETLVGNERMLGVFRHSGFDTSVRYADGVMHVTMEICASVGDRLSG